MGNERTEQVKQEQTNCSGSENLGLVHSVHDIGTETRNKPLSVVDSKVNSVYLYTHTVLRFAPPLFPVAKLTRPLVMLNESKQTQS